MGNGGWSAAYSANGSWHRLATRMFGRDLNVESDMFKALDKHRIKVQKQEEIVNA